MVEQLISNITVHTENLSEHDTGGAYRTTSVNIYVDSSLSLRRQAVSATHEVLGAYLQTFISREDIEEIAESIIDILGEVLFKENPMEGIEDD
jgi:hypothetical protein